MAHLKGNQWRESERAISKKARAKGEHFNTTTETNSSSDLWFVHDGGSPKGIVICSVSNKVSLLSNKVQYECIVSKLAPRNLSKGLVPGDIVTLSLDENPPIVAGLIARENVLSRMRRDSTRLSFAGAKEQIIAANIDIAVVVASAQNPPFHPKFIDRYIILLQHNGIAPVVCLNKVDLAKPAVLQKLKEYEKLGIKTITTSTTTHEGIEDFRDLMFGKVAVLVGHSGVGKTSLINAIDPAATYRTGVISTKSGKGQHTTTSSSLHVWDENSYIIDTPGIRSLEIWDIDKHELQYYYPEFETLVGGCKFLDCVHQNEPEDFCGIKNAIGRPSGVSKDRYESYLKILGEL